MTTSKPRITADKLSVFNKYEKAINAAIDYRRNSRLFGGLGSSIGGGYHFADTKHTKSWKDYGFPDRIDFFMHWNMFTRNGYAFGGITIPNTLMFMTKPWVQQDNKTDADKETDYEREFRKFAKRVKLWKVWREVYEMQRVGAYAGLFFVVKDGKTPDKPLGKVRLKDIIELVPMWEGQLLPSEIDQNPASERRGLPNVWTYNESEEGNRNQYATQAMTIHHTRVVTIKSNAKGRNFIGQPENEAGFNSLLNLEKIEGAGGEGFWRQAAQRFVMEAIDGEVTPEPEELEALSEVFQDIFAGMDKVPFVGNNKLVPLNSRIDNPDSFTKTALGQYCASRKGLPAKFLQGTQTGVKAADEDAAHFMRMLQSERVNECAEQFQKVIDFIGEHTELKEPDDGATLCWDDITAPSKAAMVGVALDMIRGNAESLKAGGDLVWHNNEIRTQAGDEAVDALGDWDDNQLLPEEQV